MLAEIKNHTAELHDFLHVLHIAMKQLYCRGVAIYVM